METISWLDNKECSFVVILHRKKTERYTNPHCMPMFSELRLAAIVLLFTSQQIDNSYKSTK